jgi:predicted nucleotidyltransferase
MKELSCLSENEYAAVMSLKEELCKRYSVLKFRLFGSKVRGEGTPESDIDVMIEIATADPGIESGIDDLIFETNLKHDTFISAVIFSEKEITEGPLSESPLYKMIEKEGVPL